MNIENEILKLKERNEKVEADKAWEISLSRKILISIFTYVITALIFYLIGIKDYLQNALIPTIAYFLSIQSLPVVKKWWMVKCYNKTRKAVK